jgi:hypothetical protein
VVFLLQSSALPNFFLLYSLIFFWLHFGRALV